MHHKFLFLTLRNINSGVTELDLIKLTSSYQLSFFGGKRRSKGEGGIQTVVFGMRLMLSSTRAVQPHSFLWVL